MDELYDMSIAIPSKFRFSITHESSSTQIQIPIETSANRIALLIHAMVYMLSLPAGGEILLGVLVNISNDPDNIKYKFALMLVPFIIIFSFLGVAVAITCFKDALLSFPSLTIDFDQLNDRRSGMVLQWSSVRHISFLTDKRGISGVSLLLYSNSHRKSNFFRLGSEYRTRKNSQLLVPLRMMSIDPYILAHAIAEIVRQHGGSSETTRWS